MSLLENVTMKKLSLLETVTMKSETQIYNYPIIKQTVIYANGLYMTQAICPTYNYRTPLSLCVPY